MKTVSARLLCGVCLVAVISSALPSAGAFQKPPAADAPQPLFTPVAASSTVSRQSPRWSKHVIRRAVTTVSEKAVASGAILNAEAHVLNLFPDVNILAMRRRVESRSSRDYSWIGFIPGDDSGRVIITVVKGKLGAVVDRVGKHYMVMPTSDGFHEILEIDGVSFDQVDDTSPAPRYPVRVPVNGRPDSKIRLLPTPLDLSGWAFSLPDWTPGALYDTRTLGELGRFPIGKRDDGSVIDVMVVYTHQAARAADPLHQTSIGHSATWTLLVKIQMAIDVANDSFDRSGVPTRLELVADPFEDQDYAEAGTLEADLNAIRDGHVGDVHQRRNQFAADLVVFVTAYGSEPAWGKAFTRERDMTPAESAANGYIVVPEYGLNEYHLAHEVGHTLGATHENSAFPGGNLKPYAHGYVLPFPNTNQGVYTIMATFQECRYVLGISCERIGRWSNPYDVTQQGLPLGIPEGMPHAAHDARAISEELLAVANYRLSSCRLNGC